MQPILPTLLKYRGFSLPGSRYLGKIGFLASAENYGEGVMVPRFTKLTWAVGLLTIASIGSWSSRAEAQEAASAPQAEITNPAAP